MDYFTVYKITNILNNKESPFKGKKHSPETKSLTRQKEHSERVKQWWADRKAATGV